MKEKNYYVIGLFALALALASCQPLEQDMEQDMVSREWQEVEAELSDSLIQFTVNNKPVTKAVETDGCFVSLATNLGGVKDLSVITEDICDDIDTRADVTSLSSFKCTMTSGTKVSNQTQVWNNVTFSQVGSSNVYTGSQYWPGTNQTFRFFAANRDITFNKAGCTLTVPANTSEDCVCVFLSSPTFQGSNTLNFKHIFAKIGTLTVIPDSGLDIRNVSVSMTPKRGTYNIRTDTWSSVTEGSSVTVYSIATVPAAGITISPVSDIYTIADTYYFYLSWDLYVDGTLYYRYSENIDLSLTKGKINNLRVTLSDNDPVWKTVTFAGMSISPGHVIYKNGQPGLLSSWFEYNSYNSIHGIENGSTYFTFVQLGKMFSSSSFSSSSGSIDNNIRVSFGGYNDWRLPTRAEYNKIISTDSSVRPGSTVNSNANKHWVVVELTDVSIINNSDPYGLLVFPDNCTISGATLKNVDSTPSSTSPSNLTLAQLNAYIRQGCAFFPLGGVYSSSLNSWHNDSFYGYYTASCTSDKPYYLTCSVSQKPNVTTPTTIGSNGADYYKDKSHYRNYLVRNHSVASFGGLMIAPSPLYYNGTTFKITDNNWNHDSYNSIYGKNSGSYYFSYINVGQYFDSRGSSFSTSSGNIDNNGSKVAYDGYDDWRMPTKADFEKLITTDSSVRPGSTVNETANIHYALIQLTGVSHAGTTTPNGLLLFPDGLTITGKALSGMDNTTQTTGVTAAQLQKYLDQGCVFIPASGMYGGSYVNGGTYGFYLNTTQYNASYRYYLIFGAAWIDLSNDGNKTTEYAPVRLVRDAD